jgi:diamine N-acetyltransferase
MAKAPSLPFRAERYDLGLIHDGQRLSVEPVADANIASLAADISRLGPWAFYGRTPLQLAERLRGSDDGIQRYQLVCGSQVAGAIAIWREWLIGPNLQMLAVREDFQRIGAGGAVLRWFEAEARLHERRNIWLCVSGFNTGAIKFYERHGFVAATVIDNLLQSGVDELLMRKLLK